MDEKPKAIVKTGPDSRDWYVVATATGLISAEIPAGLLRSAGIPVYLFREAISSSAIPLTFGPLAGVDIAVPEAYYLEAKTLLEEPDADDVWDELPPGIESPNSESPDEDA